MKPQKPTTPPQRLQPDGDIVPPPYNHLYTPRAETADRLLTTLMLAGEALAAPLRSPQATDPALDHASPIENNRPAFFDDFAWLCDLAAQIQAQIAEDPRRAELLTHLREALGDGTKLRLLFRYLLQSKNTPPIVDGDGKIVLTEREVQLLREAAADRSQEEIAARLGIAPYTVNTHMKHVYRKLGVRRPMQAVARAISMGFLDLDDLQFVSAAAGCSANDFGAFNTFLSTMGALQDEITTTSLNLLGEFGVLLLVLCGAAAQLSKSDRSNQAMPKGILYELSARGDVNRSFGADHLHKAWGIAVAPPHAAQHGFTPGHLFVSQQAPMQQGLNDATIAEFTPEGQFVRTFCGGKEIGTRLIVANSLVFDTHGQLLVTSDGLTDAILAFRQGGATVRPFANGCYSQICVSGSGEIYAAQYSSIGCIIKVFNAHGRLLRTIGGTAAGVGYYGIAVDSRGHVFVNRTEQRRDVIEEYDAGGEHVRSFPVPGSHAGRLTIDAQDRLYVPCSYTNDIKVVSPDGTVLQRIELPGKATPFSVAVGEAGRLWVSGHIT